MRFLAALLLSVSAYAQTGVLVNATATIPAGTLSLTPYQSLVTVYPSSVQNGVLLHLTAPTSHLYAIVGLTPLPGPGLITSTDWVIDRGMGGTQDELVAIWAPPFAAGMDILVQYASVVGESVEFTNQVVIFI